MGFSPGAVRRFRSFPARRHRLSPAVSRVRSVVSCGPGFGSRSRFSGPLFAVLRSGSRQENRVLLSLRSGAASAACRSVRSGAVRSAFRPAPASLRLPGSRFSGLAFRPAPASFRLPGSRFSGLAFRPSCRLPPVPFKSGPKAVRLRPKIPVYHPVPASCSARLLFVSFMVRISKFRLIPFCSVQLSSSHSFACSSCSVPFVFVSF